jgi:hypothetical protein
VKRSPLHRRTTLTRGKPLRRVSVRRLSESAERRRVLAAVRDRDGDGCFASRRIQARPTVEAPRTCAGPLDGHEVIPRSAWPGGHLIAWNVRLVCRRHHEWIHANPVTAVTLGLLSKSWDRPASVAFDA